MEIKKAQRPNNNEELKDKPKKTNKTKKPEKVERAIDKLSPKHKEFLLNYFELGMNGRKAYMKTYPTATEKSAYEMSSRLLRNINILNAKHEYLESQWLAKEKAISDMYNKLITVASADISDFIDSRGDVKVDSFNDIDTYPIAQYEQSISDTANGRNIKRVIKLQDRQKAIDTLTKVLGMIQEKVEHSGVIEIKPAERPEED